MSNRLNSATPRIDVKALPGSIPAPNLDSVNKKKKKQGEKKERKKVIIVSEREDVRMFCYEIIVEIVPEQLLSIWR